MSTVVIGAGPGGLAVAAALQQRGETVTVVDKAAAVGSSWRGHYDRLHLHTPRELSGLPGYPIPRRFGRWVSRDDVVRYLELYAAHHRLDVRTGVEVTDLAQQHGGWTLTTADGASLDAENVVVATGYNNTPAMPTWPGTESFTGEIIHASAYRNGEPWRGRGVLVVGIGNTGAEIATDLGEHGAGPVWIGVRTPPYILVRDRGPMTANLLGIMVRHLPVRVVDRLQDRMLRLETPDLSAHGLSRPSGGLYSKVLAGTIPVQDVGIVGSIQSGSVVPVKSPARFEGDEVMLTDGSRLRPDAVVVAAGYRQNLEPLVGDLGVLDARGLPRSHGAEPALPGLYFTGFTNPISGMFRELRIDATRIARAIRPNRRAARGVTRSPAAR